jgi:surface antigen
MKRLFSTLACAALCAWVPAAAAMNLIPLLQDTPAQFYTDEDYALFDGALKQALNELGPQGAAQWENPRTGAGGTVTVREQFEQGGAPCKRLRLESHARNRRGDTTMTFCRHNDGRWVLPPS